MAKQKKSSGEGEASGAPPGGEGAGSAGPESAGSGPADPEPKPAGDAPDAPTGGDPAASPPEGGDGGNAPAANDAAAGAPAQDAEGGAGAGGGDAGGDAGGELTDEQKAEQALALRPDERERLLAAPTVLLEELLAEDGLPPVWKVEVSAELERRRATPAQAMRTRVRQYAVMRGGRFVVNGSINTLATGSIITEHSHDLMEVVKQGIALRELEEDEEVVVVRGQLGEQTTRVQRKA